MSPTEYNPPPSVIMKMNEVSEMPCILDILQAEDIHNIVNRSCNKPLETCLYSIVVLVDLPDKSV
jgi:hypothetical protein